MAVKKKSVSLVLGSGGARGYAHIGVIRWLEENGYEIRSVVGCSMGAVIGGVYAVGKLQEYADWVCNIDRMDVFRLLDFTLGEGGLVRGRKIINAMKEFMEDRNIEDLPVHYTAVATDLAREREVWINHGNIFEAMRASMALPLFFTPYEYKGAWLLDGGILNPVPIAPTFHDGTDLCIAVNLAGPPQKQADIDKEVQAEGSPRPLTASIQEFLQSLWESDDAEAKLGYYDVVNQSVDAMQGTIARLKIATYPPDVLIQIPRNLCMPLEFDRAREIIEAGYRETADQMEKPAQEN